MKTIRISIAYGYLVISTWLPFISQAQGISDSFKTEQFPDSLRGNLGSVTEEQSKQIIDLLNHTPSYPSISETKEVGICNLTQGYLQETKRIFEDHTQPNEDESNNLKAVLKRILDWPSVADNNNCKKNFIEMIGIHCHLHYDNPLSEEHYYLLKQFKKEEQYLFEQLKPDNPPSEKCEFHGENLN